MSPHIRRTRPAGAPLARTSSPVGMERARAAALLLCCIVLTGCADIAGGGDTTADMDGLRQLTATPDMRIGSVDDPDVGFSRLGYVDVDADGNIYALEMLDNQIRVYSPDGRIVRRIGRSGSGPGEFESAPRFGIQGDTLWALDGRAGRITLFDRTGNVLSTGTTNGLRVPLPTGYGYVLPMSMRPDGTFTSSLSRVAVSANDPATGVQAGDSIPVPRVRFDAAGSILDTIGWAPTPPPRLVPPAAHRPERQRITFAGREYTVPEPPSELPRWHDLDDGYISVEVPYATTPDAGTITVSRIGLTNDTVYSRVLNYQPQPFTAAQLDSAALRGARGPMMLSGPAQAAPAPELVSVMRTALRFPEFSLPVRTSWIAQDESVWLQREEPGTNARWIVLGPDGTLRGEVQLPAGSRPLWNRGDTLWVSEPDELDVPWLVRYRIAG